MQLVAHLLKLSVLMGCTLTQVLLDVKRVPTASHVSRMHQDLKM